MIEALKANPHLREGLSVHGGAVTRREVAVAQGYAWPEPESALRA